MPDKTNLRLQGTIAYSTLMVLLLCAGTGRAQSDVATSHLTGDSKRAVTVADAIEMTRAGDNAYLSEWDKSGNVALFSPDGSKFAFITQQGDLKRDVIKYSIWIFDTASALTSPKPKLVTTLASSSNRPAISQLKWLPDNNTLAFLGEQPGEVPQIYEVDSRTGNLQKLTNQSTPIVEFSMTDSGHAFTYLAELKADSVFSGEQVRRGFVVTPEYKWEDIYLNRREFDLRREIYVKTSHMRLGQKVGVVQQNPWKKSLSISPDGRYALLVAFNTAPPAIWEDYKFQSDGSITYSRPACLTGEIRRCPEQYWLLDLQEKSIRPLINAPNVYKDAGESLAIWVKENTLLLVNALLPLDTVDGPERIRRQRNVYAAEVAVPTGEVHPFDEREEVLPAYYIESDRGNGRLLTMPEMETLGSPFEFRNQDGRWRISTISPAEAERKFPVSVTLAEGINTPPRLVATDPKAGKNTVLLDLNPQFAHLTFGRVEVIHWKTRDGRPSGGELYYPTDYVAGKRYPLVIQTHAESRERFWIDGPFSTANAAQALANKDFFVLQMGYGDRYDKAAYDEIVKVYDTQMEGPFFVSFVESAIDELDRRGYIDRGHVGIGGFSRTVFQAEYLLTHSSYPFGAAVMADGVDFGYVGCLYFFVPNSSSLCERMNGGLPWGDSLANWVNQSPPMRLDKIRTPLLMQSITAPLGEWEIYAALQWLKKPVELENFYPEGAHELVRPQQKYLSQQSAVDWYCFWLKGEEDPEPAKAEQYKRWRELWKQQEANAAAARPN